jgi:hypothetical protein
MKIDLCSPAPESGERFARGHLDSSSTPAAKRIEHQKTREFDLCFFRRYLRSREPFGKRRSHSLPAPRRAPIDRLATIGPVQKRGML